jgi:murein L,D-transpeptidase YcbB/YkuD
MVLVPLWNAGRRHSVRTGLAVALCGASALTGVYMLATTVANAEVAAIAPPLVPAALQETTPPPAVAPLVTGDAELRARLEAPGTLSVSGERLHASLLRQFYTRHGFEQVWPTHPAQAEALLQTAMRSGEHGLDPELFHAAALRNLAALPPLDRELLVSDTILAFAEALSRGAIPLEDRMDDEDLKAEPIDIAAVVDNAIAAPRPGAVIEALAPQTANYLALRRALPGYQAAAAAAATSGTSEPAAKGMPGRARTADRGAAAAKLRQIIVNLERQRWLPRNIPADRVWVNAASAHLTLFRANVPIFSTRVVVGDTDKQTPELQSMITSLLFNPPWNIPAGIAQKEILPKLSSQPDYLARHRMQMRHGGGIQQLPGPGSALGQLKFEMADRFDVYLHDTPLKNLFSRDNRQQSHGCVRVQNPRELAALLDGQPVESINKGIAVGSTNRRYLPTPVAVFIVYQTAFSDANGAIEFRPDVYERDDEIWQKLHPNRQAPVAQHESPGQRRG